MSTLETESATLARFMQHYAEIQRRLYVFIIRMLPDSAEAEDLLQETNLLLWQKFDQFEPGSDFYSWACRIAKYKLMNYRSSRKRSTVMLDPAAMDAILGQSADCSAEHDENRRAALAGCIERLSDADRGLIRRRYEPGASVQSIAEQIGRTPNSLSKTLGRIRRALSHCIERTLGRESEATP